VRFLFHCSHKFFKDSGQHQRPGQRSGEKMASNQINEEQQNIDQNNTHRVDERGDVRNIRRFKQWPKDKNMFIKIKTTEEQDIYDVYDEFSRIGPIMDFKKYGDGARIVPGWYAYNWCCFNEHQACEASHDKSHTLGRWAGVKGEKSLFTDAKVH